MPRRKPESRSRMTWMPFSADARELSGTPASPWLLDALPEILPNPEPNPATTATPLNPGQPPRPTLRREWLLLLLALLLFAAVILPPLVNLGRYQHRITDSMSRSLGRQVTLRSATLRLLPVPSLVLTDVVVYEQPGFGAEPALRAPSVIARLRLNSLWRGRLEISQVEISDASLNLVRDRSGRWNVGSILLQASHLANAPTAQPHPGPQPRFPYIEITDSRINVKQGPEKLPYSLLNTNLSMWLDQPELWQIRLDGQPVRTDVDMGLSDTGTLRIEGSLHRATALGHMPIALHADWSNAPLGQASRLLLGSDRGWRGDIHATADVSGDLDSLAIQTHFDVPNLHREEFTPSEPFAVNATCRATYSRSAHALSGLHCRWPVGTGLLLLSGSLSTDDAATASQPSPAVTNVADVTSGPGVTNSPAVTNNAAQAQNPDQDQPPTQGQSTLALTVRELPAGFLVAAAGLARSDFAPSFHLTGALSGILFYTAHAGQAPLYAGVLEAPLLHLEAPGLDDPLEFTDTRLAAATPTPSGVSTLVLSTAPVDLGGPTPTTVTAQLSTQGILLHIAGSAALARLEDLGRATHLTPDALARLAPQGTAEFDVTRTTGWQQPDPLSQPTPSSPAAGPASGQDPLRAARAPAAIAVTPPPEPVTGVTGGWLRLHNAIYAPRFLSEPVSLPAAQATFLPGQIAWTIPQAIYHQLPIQLTATYPLDCANQPTPVSSGCVTTFRAGFSTLDAQALASALLSTGGGGQIPGKQIFDHLLNRLDNDAAARWPALEGTLHANTFTLGRLALHNATAELSVADGRATIRSLDAQALNGSLHAEGSLSLVSGVPSYTLNTTLTHVTATAAGQLFHENWGPGALTLTSTLELTGTTAAQLAASAEGEFHAEWTRGALGSSGPGGAQTPLAHFTLWTAGGSIANQTLTLTQAQLTPAPNAPPVPISGTIAFDRTLDLHLGQPSEAVESVAATGTHKTAISPSVSVTGTLSKPGR